MLEAWGWNGRWEALLRESGTDQGQPARVTSHHRDRWMLQTAEGSQSTDSLRR